MHYPSTVNGDTEMCIIQEAKKPYTWDIITLCFACDTKVFLQ
jgi:hypothetical protein